MIEMHQSTMRLVTASAATALGQVAALAASVGPNGRSMVSQLEGFALGNEPRFEVAPPAVACLTCIRSISESLNAKEPCARAAIPSTARLRLDYCRQRAYRNARILLIFRWLCTCHAVAFAVPTFVQRYRRR